MSRNPYRAAIGWIAVASLAVAVFLLLLGVTSMRVADDQVAAVLPLWFAVGFGSFGLSWGSTWLVVAALTYKAPAKAKSHATATAPVSVDANAGARPGLLGPFG